MIKRLASRVLERQKARLAFVILISPLEAALISITGLFDRDWYRRQYCGDRTEEIKSRIPLFHYLVIGRKKGLTPNPFFTGEYYDRWRWQQSIVDPTVKYILRRNTWHQPTSPIFDGGSFGGLSRVLPPLSVYLRHLRRSEDAKVFHDRSIHPRNEMMWSDIRDGLYSGVNDRTAQHMQRKVAEPVNRFDAELERETTQRYLNFFDKESKPLVSIVMPAWNRQELIRAAIESVQGQTYENWELLVVDDGSTDNTTEVVRAYSAEDPRVKLFTPGHGGVCKARNHGIEHAQGEWVAFLDSDNEWTSDFLLTTVASLVDSDRDAGYAAIEMNNNGHVRYRTTKPSPNLLETGNFVDLNALVVRKVLLDEVGSFDEGLRRMVDYDLVIRISKQSEFLYVPIVGVKYTDHEDLARITTTESLSWDGVVKSKNFIDWEEKQAQSDNKTVSIVLPVRGAIMLGVKSLTSLIAHTENDGEYTVEIIISDASSNSAMNVTMCALAKFDSRVKYYREPATRDTILATNYGFARAKGSVVVVLDQHATVEGGWLEPLLAPLSKDTVVSPLLLKPSRVIASAGVELQGDKIWPVSILEDHPLSDVAPLDEAIQTDALTAGCFAVQSRIFAQLRGLNPLYDKGFEVQDFCLRAQQLGVKCVLAKDSQVVSSDEKLGRRPGGLKQYISDWEGKAEPKTSPTWREAGFDVVSYEHGSPEEPAFAVPRVQVRDKKPGEYRWAIKISSPSDERRHIWGDTHYAMALAKSLTKLGQRVAIDYHDHHTRPTSYLDDVVLDLRGLDDTQPQEGALNIMWVISHPEKVTPGIVNKFDLVFAAGKKWAEYMTQQSARQVAYLPQCTDPEVFYPTEPDPQFEGKVLFVGSSRNALRPIVRDAIAAGIDINVYGGGWEGLIDPKYIKGAYIPNDRLTYAYSSASVVLNDHWEDMREWGFISNRIFDALAAGGYVISDDVTGLSDTIQSRGLSVDFSKVAESGKYTENEKSKTIENIYDKHSFDSRAKTICQSAINSLVGQEDQ